VIVGALKSVGAVVRGRISTGNTGKAEQLADQLMAEILQSHYREPIDTPVFGQEATESSSLRSSWDDVDDYHLWAASPPQNRPGTVIPDSIGWGRSVTVAWVNPSNPALTVGSDQGVKRITVTVQWNGQVLATKTALRSNKYSGI
jgi:hypothetical protein